MVPELELQYLGWSDLFQWLVQLMFNLFKLLCAQMPQIFPKKISTSRNNFFYDKVYICRCMITIFTIFFFKFKCCSASDTPWWLWLYTSEFVAGPRPLILVSNIPGNCSAWENGQNCKWKGWMDILVLISQASVYKLIKVPSIM